jgi:hypothetical protein
MCMWSRRSGFVLGWLGSGCRLRRDVKMPAKIDVTGKRFGRLVVIGDAPRTDAGRRMVFCACDCGHQFSTDPRSLMAGHTSSCGCYQKQQVRKSSAARATHGNARMGNASPTYHSWLGAKKRCMNPAEPKYPDYGGRGISICDDWASSFDAFLRDMGTRPSGTTLDRIDPNGNYEPSNCRWATAKEQARNKRNHRLVDHDGRVMPLSEACEITGINYRSALYRLNHGAHWMPLPPAPNTSSDGSQADDQ